MKIENESMLGILVDAGGYVNLKLLVDLNVTLAVAGSTPGSVVATWALFLALTCRAGKFLVAVTIAGLKDDGYDEETAAYINGLNDINRKLFEKASIAISMQDGTPVYQKGDVHVLI